MTFLKEKTFVLGAIYYLAVSLGIILLASPLFRVLGFEYSGFIALAASLHLLFYSASKTLPLKEKGMLNAMRITWLPVLLLTLIPLIVSIISAFFIPNCSLWDGFIFYLEIVFPTAIIAMLCGVFFAMIARSKRRMNIYLALFWILTIIISLLPGYFSGRIYSFGWQYGYFPGFVWDEAMELSDAYWISRILEIALILVLILYMERKGQRVMQILAFAIIILYGIVVGNQYTNFSLDNFLSSEINVSTAHVHFKSSSFSADEIELLKYDTKSYIDEIDSTYHIKPTHKIDIYIFPSSDDLFEYVGTREASISKPWQHAIYIAKPNLHSLKHEMAHILLADYGSFPFDISWSTGLTEGAAVAIEDDYDGIESADYFSERILQMKLATGVQNVMQPSGFLSSAPTQSYVLSGSFTRYLLNCCGAEKFLQVFHDQNFEEHYGQSIEGLESDWKTWLKKFEKPMEHYDSLRTEFYFKRISLIHDPCLRRTGKLLKNADAAFREKDYRLADSLYAIAEHVSGRLKAVRGRVLSQLFQNNPKAALAILDTTASAKETNNLSALRLLRGDVMALASGDLQKASAEWEEAMKLELGDSYFLASFMRRYFFGGTNDVSAVQKIIRDLYGLEETKAKYDLVFSITPKDSIMVSNAFYFARLFLYASYIERTGKLSEAYAIWKKQLNIPKSNSDTFVFLPGEELFFRLQEKKYSRYQEVFR